MDGLTVNTHAKLDRTANILANALLRDSPGKYFLLERHGLRDTGTIDVDLQTRWFTDLLSLAVRDGALLCEVADYAGVAVWFPPKDRETEVSNGGEKVRKERNAQVDVDLGAGMAAFDALTNAARNHHLSSDRYWHLLLVARDPLRKDPGVVSRLIRPFITKACENGLCVWLEATTPHSRAVYAHYGFRTVEEVVLGKGIVNERGDVDRAGEGTRIWCMAIRPEDC